MMATKNINKKTNYFYFYFYLNITPKYINRRLISILKIILQYLSKILVRDFCQYEIKRFFFHFFYIDIQYVNEELPAFH